MKAILIIVITTLLSLSGHTQTSGKTPIDNDKLRLALQRIEEGRICALQLSLSKERISLLDESLALKDSVIQRYKEIFKVNSQIVTNYDSTIKNLVQQREFLVGGTKDLEKELRKQKRKNIFTSVAGLVGMSGLFYLLITK